MKLGTQIPEGPDHRKTGLGFILTRIVFGSWFRPIDMAQTKSRSSSMVLVPSDCTHLGMHYNIELLILPCYGGGLNALLSIKKSK